MPFRDYVINQINTHPSMEPQDAVKLCFQAAFGAEHLLEDTQAAKAYLETEYSQLELRFKTEEPLYEQISHGVCRINLRPWKQRQLPLEWLFRMFVYSAGKKQAGADKSSLKEKEQTAVRVQNSKNIFSDYLNIIGQLAVQGKLPFSEEAWETYIDSYHTSGIHAVHHSENYRRQERPAYRIVSAEFLPCLPILERIAADKMTPYIIALEGRAASGKSTLAKKLRIILDGEVIAMDDFFLPFEMRSEERMEEPGGNIHYERFIEEVLPYIRKPAEFAYRRFDCGIGDYHGENRVRKAKYRIVEGSYSTHPKFGVYADRTVFLDIASEAQKQRILARNGEEMAKKFQEKWIPLEEKYFAYYDIASKTDITLISH